MTQEVKVNSRATATTIVHGLDRPNRKRDCEVPKCVCDSNRVVYIAGTRVANNTEGVIRFHLFAVLKSGTLIG